MSNALLYPAVGGAPGTVTNRDPAQAPDRAIGRDVAVKNGLNRTPDSAVSFNQVLGGELTKASPLAGGSITEPLKFSAHASARIQSRKIDLDAEKMRKLSEAVDKAAAKGLDDTLIIGKDGAFIVSVKNRTVVTAMDRNALDGNVFTNIDGAVMM
ncbi:MAG: hypothetical protein HYW49_12080 [Deltaproteobacteria bacterium]|nr:hypothetical protein [Deltaproteobacteria bacterium]